MVKWLIPSYLLATNQSSIIPDSDDPPELWLFNRNMNEDVLFTNPVQATNAGGVYIDAFIAERDEVPEYFQNVIKAVP